MTDAFHRIAKFCGRLAAQAILVSIALGSLSATALAASDNPGLAVARLARDVDRAEAVRDVKRLQIAYAQYSQFGLWNEMAALFADRAELIYGKDTARGRKAIAAYFLNSFGNGRQGLPPGGLHTQMVFDPIVNLSVDGKTAKARWHEVSMLGRFGANADWAGGVEENEYVKERGVWKFARLHYFPIFAGPYAAGWRNVDADQKVVPYHYTPDEAGTPVPDAVGDAGVVVSKQKPAARLLEIGRRVSAMNDEDKVRNLQNAYGYYVDRKMWDDVTDLFTEDGTLEIADLGVYSGVKSIRRALERHGPAGLLHGQLNDHVMPDTLVTISPGGMEAHARGIEFAMLGDADSGTASMGLAVFENRYVKQDGVWRIREVRIFPVMNTDYYQGWAKSALHTPAPAAPFAPDAPVRASDAMDGQAFPVFRDPNPGSGKPVAYPAAARIVGGGDLLSPVAVAPAPHVTLAEAQRELAVSKAYDGVDNISAAFDWINDYQWDKSSALFTKDGRRQKYLVGFYIGPERIRQAEVSELGELKTPRGSIDNHFRTQPVIDVAPDGKSANIRTRLLLMRSSATRAGAFSSGMYPNDHAVLDGGVWKFTNVAIDEPYFQSASYADGWARFPAPVPPPSGPRKPTIMDKLIHDFPPDIPLTTMPMREQGFGGDAKIIEFPDIKPMWFSYRNPVSGRVPPYYCPDETTCEKDLEKAK